MYNETTFDLRFIIGVTFGFIARHDKKLRMSTKSETKEDYEQTILYYLKDGGVIRFNNITTKTATTCLISESHDATNCNEK